MSRPPRPAPPPDDPRARAVGGAALATAGLVVPPGAASPPALTATSWLVADLDTGAVLGACGPHEYGTPASVQKLLLAATVLPKLNPKQVVTVTAADLDIEPGSSAVGLVQGRPVSRSRRCGWGCCSTPATTRPTCWPGSAAARPASPGTIAAMNAEARRLGAVQTHAVTPSGLDGPGQFTSAYDLALIARACFANADLPPVHADRARADPRPARAEARAGSRSRTRTSSSSNYPGALGGKTGFTDLARHTYVGAASRGGRRLVATLLGAEARPLRGWQQGAALLDWGFALPASAAVGRLVDPQEAQPASPTPAVRESAPAKSAPAALNAGNNASLDADSAGWPLAVAVAVTALVAVVVLLRTRAVRRRARRRRSTARARPEWPGGDPGLRRPASRPAARSRAAAPDRPRWRGPG